MIKRPIAGKRLKFLATKFRAVAVVGPRQSGKTTLCRSCFPRKPYVSLENPDVAEFATADPKGFLAQFKNGAIIDEAQKLPHLFSYLQQIIDEQSKSGLFILTGSNNFLMQQSITQTLAGRVAYLHLLPCTVREIKSAKLLPGSYNQQILQGFYPEPVFQNIAPTDWFPNYINTYVERDVRQLKNIGSLSKFAKFMKLCAGRTGQILNMESIGNDAGIDGKTVRSWLDALQSSYIIYLLRPYHNNFNKRIIQAPKLYFYDTGLACSLLGIQSEEQLTLHHLKGALFENYVIIELLKQRFNLGKADNLYYWRDKTGNEVDVLIEEGKKLIAMEIKAAATFTPDFQKGLLYFQLQTGKQKIETQLIYAGKSSQQRSNGIIVKPLKSVF